MRVAVYGDSSGAAGPLLAQSSSVATTNGWNDAAVTEVNLTTGTTYWLALQDDNIADLVYYNYGGSLSYSAYSYGPFPNPAGSSPASGGTFDMRMTYAAVSTTTTTSITSTSTTSSTTTAATTTIPPTGSNVNIEIVNNQSLATPSSFQQMVLFNPQNVSQGSLAPDLGNIRFYQGQQELYSWCESGCSSGSNDAMFWVKLPDAINAHSNLTLNITFQSNNTEYDDVYAGEEPQLSSVYGQYDNGADVFSEYWDFAGPGLPTSWLTGGGGSGAVNVNDGINVSVASGAYDAYYPDTISSSTVMDELSSSQYVAPSQASSIGFADNPSPLGNLAAVWYYGGGYGFWSNSGTWFNGYYSSVTTQAYNTKTVFSTYYVPSTSLDWYVNYTPSASAALSAVPASSALTYIIIGWPNGGGSSTETVYWLRLRAYPPDGVMPAVTLN